MVTKGFFYLETSKEIDMTTTELPKAYDFKSTEERIYQWWEKHGYFQPVNDPNKPSFNPDRKPYVISIPPPNITGELHLGSALFVSLEDLIIE
jgi:valyl-tRNA synthetase